VLLNLAVLVVSGLSGVLGAIGRILLSYLVHMHGRLRSLRQGQVHVGPITWRFCHSCPARGRRRWRPRASRSRRGSCARCTRCRGGRAASGAAPAAPSTPPARGPAPRATAAPARSSAVARGHRRPPRSPSSRSTTTAARTSTTSASSTATTCPLFRRADFSNWLQDSVCHRVQGDVGSLNDARYLENILLLLTGRQLDTTTEIAASRGDVRLAILLSQAGGSMSNRSDLAQTLDQWKMNGLDFDYIEED
jgi:hypothetical protein